MLTQGERNFTKVLLLFLVVLDIVLSTTAVAFPQTWFDTFHHAPYFDPQGYPQGDPQGLLRRTGAVWIAFTVLQAIAFFRWEKQPYWLPLIAGVRLTELFSDWTYLYFAQSITTWGRLGLLIAPPGNLVFGWILISNYKKLIGSSGRG